MKKLLLSVLLIGLWSTFAIGQVFDIYVSDGGNFNLPPWQILKFDENGENHEVFINEELAWPQDIVFLEDQNVVLISNLNTGRITRYNADSGVYIDNFATGLAGPTRMKIGSDSLLYVVQWGMDGKVVRFQLDGTPVDEYTDTGVTNGIGLDWDSDGKLYVSSYGGNFVRLYDQNGMDQDNFISSGLQGPTNIWFDDNGDLLANNWNGTTVKRFNSDGEFIEDFITGLSNPEGIAIYPNGNMLIGNGGTSAVKLFDPQGNFIEDIIPSGAGGLILPNAVVLREKTTVSTHTPIEETAFLTSNIGTVFHVTPGMVAQIASVEIYDINGNWIDQQHGLEGVAWDATNQPSGLYLIQAKLKNEDKIYVQKVHVSH